MARRSSLIGKIVHRAALIPPIFLSIFLCVWTASAVLPFSVLRVCYSGRRMDVRCFPKEDSNHLQVSTDTQIQPLPLRVEQFEGGDENPPKPLRDVRSLRDDPDLRQVVRQDEGEGASPIPSVITSASMHGNSQTQINKRAEDIPAAEVVKIMEDLRSSAASKVSSSEDQSPEAARTASSSCQGKQVYIYDLPAKFNSDILDKCDQMVPWLSMCDYFSNSGLGKVIEKLPGDVLVPAGHWYVTHQYSLEVYFHERLKQYPCLTTNPVDANLFFIPFYGGLDVLRWHFHENVSNAQRDQLGLELISWLKEQPSWRRNDGIDHVLVLGKVSWDFRRVDTDTWGNNLLMQPEMQQLTKVLIERQPWHPNDIGVPHPTFFHPRTDRDFREWQGRTDGSHRKNLISFAGMPRPKQQQSIRSFLIQQCVARPSSCYFLQCVGKTCLQPNTTMQLFMQSEFCLQPPGDSPTRRSIFDSLIAGCIPVLFDPYSAYYQYPWHLPADPSLYSVYIPARDVREGKVNVVEELEKIPKSKRQEMRVRIIYEIMPGLVYAEPGARLRQLEDAFQISLRGLFSRVESRLATSHTPSNE